jgi:hypothetical protein
VKEDFDYFEVNKEPVRKKEEEEESEDDDDEDEEDEADPNEDLFFKN